MNPYQQGQSGYPRQQYLHNVGFSNSAPQTFGNPMPMPGFPTMGYPTAQPGYPNTSGYPQPGYPQANTPTGYPQPSSGYPQPGSGYPQSSSGYPQPSPGYPPTGYPQPTSAQGYPQSNPAQSYSQPAQTGYPQSGYPQQSQGYSQSNQGYPQSSQGYPSANQYQGYRPNSQQTQSQAYNVSSGHIPAIKSKPTVVPANPFDPREDAAVLRKAMKGFGTDEKAIIQVLTRRSNEQRLRIAFEFKTLYGKDLISDLKSETTGKFEDLVVALMTPLPQFYAKELHDATAGIGTDEDVLIEVMCTLSNHEIHVIKQAYTAMYGTLLEDDLRGDTSGNFKRLMTSLCMGNRSEDFHVNQEKAREDARSLLQAGELRLGTDESTFNAVLCSRSFTQLAAVFQEYQFLTGHDIDDAIKAEFSGDMEKAFRAIVKVVRNKPLYFAERLHKSMKGLGTNDRQLIRIMVTRCEVDLGDISDMFQSKYGETLQSWIEGDCSGHYKKCLLGLLGLY
ncbi:annexin B9-like isoform X1 [Hyposmocoma kahamanoa]|uniref:annexin B9-like isoform X1 n=1 Tax=Hyposmocoma kahamanoa TaxID=1477025 RepID=UPI000E6D958D|nr:annexin B9-like isoform X1 [Hyposmocoma kahamanoa]XP_026329371.1 annexin B9-like isoform X1 [Hyposmocoma kahamanoa]